MHYESEYEQNLALKAKNPRAWLGYVFINVMSASRELHGEGEDAESDLDILTTEFAKEFDEEARLYQIYPVTTKNVGNLLTTLVRVSKKNVSHIVERVDNVLSSLESEDFFGTEGQDDPRGDHR